MTNKTFHQIDCFNFRFLNLTGQNSHTEHKLKIFNVIDKFLLIAYKRQKES